MAHPAGERNLAPVVLQGKGALGKEQMGLPIFEKQWRQHPGGRQARRRRRLRRVRLGQAGFEQGDQGLAHGHYLPRKAVPDKKWRYFPTQTIRKGRWRISI